MLNKLLEIGMVVIVFLLVVLVVYKILFLIKVMKIFFWKKKL